MKKIFIMCSMILSGNLFSSEQNYYHANFDHFSCSRDGSEEVGYSHQSYQFISGEITSNREMSNLKMAFNIISPKTSEECKYEVQIILDEDNSLGVARSTSIEPRVTECKEIKSLLDDVFSFFPYGFYSKPIPRVTIAASFFNSKNFCTDSKQLWAIFNLTQGL